ncbi:MAG TPA: hypothetical protein VHO90_16535 [Bacteroidales bacterium]|nr:hypothetical protein [Bacteroidales bacterium]
MMKRFSLSLLDKKFLLILVLCVLVLNACEDNGVGEPMPAKMKVESATYNVPVSKTAIADTTVATIRWIDIKSPSYTLTLTNSVNDTKIELTQKGTAAENDVMFITLSDKQVLDYLTQMQLTDGTSATLTLTITGTKSDGVSDKVATTINVTLLDAS